MPDPITIKIEVDNLGNFTYHNALEHVGYPPAPVSWICEDGPFTLSFTERTPFVGVVTIQSGRAQASVPPEYRPDIEPGTYHYIVAAVAVDGTVHIDAGCPGVEIP